MQVTCPGCNKNMNIKDSNAGKRGKCPACGTMFTVPAKEVKKINVQCPHCRTPFKVKAGAWGRTAKCPSCGDPFVIGQSTEAAIKAPSPPPVPPSPSMSSPKSTPLPVNTAELKITMKQSASESGEFDFGKSVPDRGKRGAPGATHSSARSGGGVLFAESEVWKEITGMIVGAAIIGAILGYFGRGIWHPWRTEGLYPALLNLGLFAGWSIVESLGILAAHNLNIVKKRGSHILVGALAGGLWVGAFAALDFATDTATPGTMWLKAIIGLAVGFGLGGLISALCVLKISKQLAE